MLNSPVFTDQICESIQIKLLSNFHATVTKFLNIDHFHPQFVQVNQTQADLN